MLEIDWVKKHRKHAFEKKILKENKYSYQFMKVHEKPTMNLSTAEYVIQAPVKSSTNEFEHN